MEQERERLRLLREKQAKMPLGRAKIWLRRDRELRCMDGGTGRYGIYRSCWKTSLSRHAVSMEEAAALPANHLPL